MHLISQFQVSQLLDIMKLLGLSGPLKDEAILMYNDREKTNLYELTQKEGFLLTMGLIDQLKLDTLRLHIINTAYGFKLYGIESVPDAANFSKIDEHLLLVGKPPFFELTESEIDNLWKSIEKEGIANEDK